MIRKQTSLALAAATLVALAAAGCQTTDPYTGQQQPNRTGTGARNTSNVIGVVWPAGDRAPIVVTAFLTEGDRDTARRDAALAAVGAAVAAAFG